jgi:HSP20 family protein
MTNERKLSRYMSQFPKSFFKSDFFPSWDDLEDRVNQWMGKETGISVSEDSENIYIEAHVPGLQANEIDVSLDRNTLRITADKKDEEENTEKKYYRKAQRAFFYQVELPAQVEENTEQANYEDGVLTIAFKKTRKDNLKRINVKSTKESGQTRKEPGHDTPQNKS